MPEAVGEVGPEEPPFFFLAIIQTINPTITAPAKIKIQVKVSID